MMIFMIFFVAQTSKLQWTSLSVFTVFRDVVNKGTEKFDAFREKIILLTHQNGATYNSVFGHGLKKKIKVVLIKYLQTIITIKYEKFHCKSKYFKTVLFRPNSHETFWHTILRYCDKKIF